MIMHATVLLLICAKKSVTFNMCQKSVTFNVSKKRILWLLALVNSLAISRTSLQSDLQWSSITLFNRS